MKLASQEGLAPGKDLSEKLDNLAEYGYEGIEFWGYICIIYRTYIENSF